MHFELSEEQQMIRQAAKDFAEGFFFSRLGCGSHLPLPTTRMLEAPRPRLANFQWPLPCGGEAILRDTMGRRKKGGSI